METAVASRKLHVLVVDDDADTVHSTADLLALYGADVDTATDGTAAIEHAKSASFDLVLLDVGMPRLDGFQTARALRHLASAKGTTLVAVTGYGEQATKRRCAEAGFDLHLTKPVDLSVLQQLLVTVAEARGLVQQSRHLVERFHVARLGLVCSQIEMVRTLLDVAAGSQNLRTRQRCIAKALRACTALSGTVQQYGSADPLSALTVVQNRAVEAWRDATRDSQGR